jgi:hypothetical protein
MSQSKSNPVLEDYLKGLRPAKVYKVWVFRGVYFIYPHGGRPKLYPREASFSFSDMFRRIWPDL